MICWPVSQLYSQPSFPLNSCLKLTLLTVGIMMLFLLHLIKYHLIGSFTLGWSKSRCVCKGLPIISLAGDTPVVLCGVTLYWSKKQDTLDSTDAPHVVFMAALKVYTACSAKSFDAEWYSAVFRCAILFCFTNPWNSKLVNAALLSETSVWKTKCCKSLS